MISINGKEFRNLEEQVLKNKEDIAKHYAVDRVLADFGIKVVGSVDSATDLEGVVGTAYGDAYVVGTEAPYDIYIWTREDPNAGHPEAYWLDVGPLGIIGPEGPIGPRGEKGDIGERGSFWYVKNVTGTPKENDQLLDSSGDVYTLVKKEDGSLNWDLKTNIKGPQGIQGPVGPVGPQGPEGPEGPKGDTGDVGGFINIHGIVANVQQLPTPESLHNLTIAYLVGATEPYDLYIQIGETSEEAQWNNVGAFNAATLVTVNGTGQNVWSADTKVDKITDGSRVYGTAPNGNFQALTYSQTVNGNALVRRESDGRMKCADPNSNNDAVTFGFLKNNSIYWPDMEDGTIPVKTLGGYASSQTYATTNTNYSIAQRDSYGQLRASSAPVLGTTSTSNGYDSTKVSTMGNLFEHTNFSTQIRRINTSSLTAYKTLSTYGIYEFYIPEGSYIHAGAYAVNGVTTNTKLVTTGGTLKIVYTQDFMIIEGYGSDNYEYESIYVPKTDGSYGKYAVQHPTSQPTMYVKIDIFPPSGKYTLYDIGSVPTYK